MPQNILTAKISAHTVCRKINHKNSKRSHTQNYVPHNMGQTLMTFNTVGKKMGNYITNHILLTEIIAYSTTVSLCVGLC